MIASEAEIQIEKLLAVFPKGFDLSLKRVRRLLIDLGSPHLNLPPVIHVAGTNGKGSATAFTRAILECAGLVVHVHTSPHLVRWHERYRIGAAGGGRLVDDFVLSEAIAHVCGVNGDNPITVFELLTAVAFVLFARYPADVSVVETGMGGRLDATNVIAEPTVCLIMSISFDHELYLGDRIEQIASEKAGIIKPDRPVVIGHQPFPDAAEVLLETAKRLGCPVSLYGRDFRVYERADRMVYEDTEGTMVLPLPRLPGRHQIANAAAAIRAMRAGGFHVSQNAIRRGMAAAEWPARMQHLTRGRLVEQAPAGAELWIDGGHNPGAGLVIRETLAEFATREPRPLHLIVGMLKGKDPIGYLAPFTDLALDVRAVTIPSHDGALPPEAIVLAADTVGLASEPAASLEQALASLRAQYASSTVRPRILIGGSLYLAGEALSRNGTLPT